MLTNLNADILPQVQKTANLSVVRVSHALSNQPELIGACGRRFAKQRACAMFFSYLFSPYSHTL